MSKQSNNTNEIEINLKQLYLILQKGVKWLILTPIAFGLIAIIYVLFIAKPIYTSEAKIILTESDTQSSLLGLANQFGFSIPMLDNSSNLYLTVETLPEVLKTRRLTNSILFSEFNYDKSKKSESFFDIIYDQSEIEKSDSSKLIASGQNYIADNVLTSKRFKNTGIISIISNYPNPNISAQICSKTISELQKMQLDFNKSDLKNQKEFIIGRLLEIQSELHHTETRLKIFREQNLQINLSPTLLLEQERIEREIGILTELYISLKSQFEQIKIEETKSISSIKIIDNPNIPLEPSKPKRKIIVLLSMLSGIFFAASMLIIKNN